MEVQRLSCVAPAGLEHKAMKDVYFHGYFIPKGMNFFLLQSVSGIKTEQS